MPRSRTRSAPRAARARTVLLGALGLLAVAGWFLADAVPARRGAEAWGTTEHVVELTGEAHTWRVRYPGPDRRLGTADDVEGTGDLHVPRDVPTRIVLRSRDYVYTLRVLRLGVDDVAVPDIAGELRLHAAASGTYALEGGQMCGVAYPGLQGHIVVHDGSGYWAALRRTGAR